MDNKLKSFLACLIICLGLVLSGCQKKQATMPFQMAIFDNDKIVTFSNDKNELTLLETIARPTKKPFWKESFTETDKAYLARTLEGDDFKILLSSIDKETLIETVKPSQGRSIYTSITDGNYFYTTTVFTDRIAFYKYNLSMELVHQVTVPNGETQNASNQFLVINDQLYLLVSNIVVATGKPQTELWQMDKDFTITAKINLDEDSALLRMVNVGEQVYITETFKGYQSDGEPMGSKRLVTYHLGSGEKETISLSTPYPHNVYYDQILNNLVIEHENSSNNLCLWTILNLDTREEKIISFPEYQDKNNLPPFFTIKEGQYYFLFNDVLVIYNPQTSEKTEINLKQYQIQNAHALIFK